MAVAVANTWTVPAGVQGAVDAEMIGRNTAQRDSRAFALGGGGSGSRGITEQQIAQQEMALLDLTGNQIEARYLDSMGVINQQQALLDLQRGQLGKSYADQQRVFAAQRALQVARSAEYQLALRQLEQKRQELAQISAAEDNVANKAAVAAARRDASVYDPRYAMAGLQVQEIARPIDGTAPENLPPGVRYALETDAEFLGRKFQRTAANRALEAEGAGLNTAGYGLQVDNAQMTQQERDAARAKALATQQFNVSGAQINLNRNDLGRDLALDRSRNALDKNRQKLSMQNMGGGLTSVYGPLAG